MTPTEKNYSQLEHGALSIVFGIEHFRLLLLGYQYELETNDNTLEVISGNPGSTPPARVQRWMLRLQGYSFTVKFKRGVHNPEDWMSMHPLEYNPGSKKNCADKFVNFLSFHSVPNTMTCQEVANHTEKDKILSLVRDAIKTRDRQSPQIEAFAKIKNELSTHNNGRIILLVSLEHQALEIAHTGHQGITKMKMLLREKTWFPKMDAKVTQFVQNCSACQIIGKEQPPAPL